MRPIRRIACAAAAVGVLLASRAGAGATGRVPLGTEPAGVDREAALLADGTVSIGGALDCPSGVPARIDVRLVQPATSASGEGTWTGTCIGSGSSRAHRSQRWSLIVRPDAGEFVTGTGRQGLEFSGTVEFADVRNDWTQAPINLRD